MTARGVYGDEKGEEQLKKQQLGQKNGKQRVVHVSYKIDIYPTRISDRMSLVFLIYVQSLQSFSPPMSSVMLKTSD